MASTANPARMPSEFPTIWCRPMMSAAQPCSIDKFATGTDWQWGCGDTFAVRHVRDPIERLLSAFPWEDTFESDTPGMPCVCVYWFRILDLPGTCIQCYPEWFAWKMPCTLRNWPHRNEIRTQCHRTLSTNGAAIPLCSNRFDRCCKRWISHRPTVWSNCKIDVRATQATLSNWTTNFWNPNPTENKIFGVELKRWWEQYILHIVKLQFCNLLTAIAGELLNKNACELLLNVPLDGAGLQHDVVSISCFMCAWFCVSAIIDTCELERENEIHFW